MTSPFLRLLAAAAVSACALFSTTTQAQSVAQQIMGGGNKPYIDKAGYFMVVVPGGFNCEAKPKKLTCQGTRGIQALLHVEIQDVPRSATPSLVLLNQMESFKKKPHFRLVDQQKLNVDGSPAVMAAFTYDYLGNVRHGVGVQAMYVVRENRLLVVHFESRKEAFKTYMNDIRMLYASLRFAKLDKGGNPILKSLTLPKDPSQPPDPFKLNYGW